MPDIPPPLCLVSIYFVKRLNCSILALGWLHSLKIYLLDFCNRFWLREIMNFFVEILADKHALQSEHAGLYKTFCDLLKPCLLNVLFIRSPFFLLIGVKSFLSLWFSKYGHSCGAVTKNCGIIDVECLMFNLSLKEYCSNHFQRKQTFLTRNLTSLS